MTKRSTILLVDDDHAVTDYLRLKLGKDYNVLVTNIPTTVLAMARQEQPDLIMCDVDMPGMDGGDVCRTLAGDDQTRRIPFLYLTSMVSQEEVQALKGRIGGRPGVSKHAPITEILSRIKTMLES